MPNTSGSELKRGEKHEPEFIDPHILPEQFFSKNFQWTGEKRLFYGMLEGAMNCFEKFKATNFLYFPRRTQRLAYEARNWFFSEEIVWGSFLFICEHLDLVPDYLRRGLTVTYEQAKRQWIPPSDIKPNTAMRKQKRIYRLLVARRKGIIT